MKSMTKKKKRVQFELFAPKAKQVVLAGSFNGWSDSSDPLTKDATGKWKKIKMLPQGKHEYKFIIDGEWTLDVDCPYTVPNRYGTFNNVIRV